MVFVQYRAGLGFRIMVPLMFLILVSGFLGLQVKAARVHTSVELTRDPARGHRDPSGQRIVAVYPDPENTVKAAGFMEKWQGRTLGLRATGPLEKWQTSRTLWGDQRNTARADPVGLKLTGGRYVRPGRAITRLSARR